MITNVIEKGGHLIINLGGIFCESPMSYWQALKKLEGDKGAKALLSSHLDNLITMTLPEADTDIDTQHDLYQWHQRYNNKK